ncbi:DUF2057 family protein [Sodalis sp. RH22]|uniref:YccT family protein n=1 Tax=unclassified Sodalis (in: enterobacteria) TaxID=2636512 RepID=UPI0039B62429
MRFLIALVLGIGLFAVFPVLATTLRLPAEIELLIVDGAPIGSTLLRGADSLELARGRHQLVLTVSDRGSAATASRHAYTSPYIVVQFHTRNARQLTFQLPPLATPEQRDRFSRQPLMRLIDQNGDAIDTTFSRLIADREALLDALRGYNLNREPQPDASP